MANVTWPNEPFYILVNDNSFRALTATLSAGDTYVLSFGNLVPSALQLWVAIEMPTTGNGPYPALLFNVGAQGALNSINGPQVTGSSKVTSLKYQACGLDGNKIFVLSNNSYLVENSNVVSFGSSTSAVTLSLLLEQGYYALPPNAPDSSIATPKPAGIIKGFSEEPGRIVIVDNSKNDYDYQGEVNLTFEAEDSVTLTQDSSYTETVTKSVTASLGLNLSGALTKVLKLGFDASGSTTYTYETTNTVSMSTEKMQSQRQTYSITCNIDVPAKKTHQFSIQPKMIAFQTTYAFTVNLTSSLPGSPTFPITLSGNYLGVNLSSSTIIVTDITSNLVTDHTEVRRMVINHRS